MSELTITLLRLGYLALLWVLVLFADRRAAPRPVRDAHHGPSSSQGGGPAAARRRSRPSRPARAAPTRIPRSARSASGPGRLVVTEGPLRGTIVPLGSSAVLHRPRTGLHARPRRRLLVVAARADLPAGRPVVRRGPRIDERDIRGGPARRGSDSRSRRVHPSAWARAFSSCRGNPVSVALRYAARSDVGLVRSNNQDSAYAGPHLLMVADGMGGHAGGDVASSVAVAAFAPLDGESHGPDDALDQLRDGPGRRPRRDHRAQRRRPGAERHGHDGARASCGPATSSRWCTWATRAGT